MKPSPVSQETYQKIFWGCEIHPSEFMPLLERILSAVVGQKKRRFVFGKCTYVTTEELGDTTQFLKHVQRVELSFINGEFNGGSISDIHSFPAVQVVSAEFNPAAKDFSIASDMAAGLETAEERTHLRKLLSL